MSKVSRLLFKQLKAGLHEKPTAAWLFSKRAGWESRTRHDVIYVNTHANEVLMQIFGSFQVITAEQFDHRGYTTAMANFKD